MVCMHFSQFSEKLDNLSLYRLALSFQCIVVNEKEYKMRQKVEPFKFPQKYSAVLKESTDFISAYNISYF